ncbi:hypothetical protein R6Q57_000982 [Mikania cordata]
MSNSSFPSTDSHLSFNDFLDNILVDFPSENLVLPSGSDNSTMNTNTSSSGSDNCETNRWKYNPTDERLRKRLISNRESAKRSRERKQKHLQDLTNKVTRYETGNQELVNRLRFVNRNGQMVQQDNQRLKLESMRLQQRLYTLCQLLANPELHCTLLPSAWPCNNSNVTIINEQNQPTLTL